jgi:hypothetical protein
MTKSDRARIDLASAQPDTLNDISEGEFVKRWKALVGEPPSIMLSSRAHMVKVLVESVPPATTAGAPGLFDDRTVVEERVSSGAACHVSSR